MPEALSYLQECSSNGIQITLILLDLDVDVPDGNPLAHEPTTEQAAVSHPAPPPPPPVPVRPKTTSTPINARSILPLAASLAVPRAYTASPPPLPTQVLARSDSFHLAMTLAERPVHAPVDFRYGPFVALVSNFAAALVEHSIQAGTMGQVCATRAETALPNS